MLPMILYSPLITNHFRALQRWARASGAKIELNVLNFELEIRYRNRYFQFYPQFLGKPNGRFAYLPTLTDDAKGFAGWLPYKPIRYDLSTDKIYFKEHLIKVGLRTPKMWSLENFHHTSTDYILKMSTGSYGYELTGPFKQGTDPITQVRPSAAQGQLYAEQFVHGKILKVWFWGRRPFFAHVHDFAEILGDGESKISDLIRVRLLEAGMSMETCPDRSVIDACLEFQSLTQESVIGSDATFFIDYRYGRDYQTTVTSSESDSRLGDLPDAVIEQLANAGAELAATLEKQFPAPVMYALDGVLDKEGQIWWLEINSNPVLPPDGYVEIFKDLFGAQT
jgi:uncharacterized glyoxalase superfamily protein PhnB